MPETNAVQTKVEELCEAGDTVGALKLARDFSKVNPEDPDGWTALGLAQMRIGLHPEAERSLRQAISLGPKGPVPYLLVANIMRSAGRRAEALGMLTLAAEQWPNHADAQGLLGNLLLEQNELPGAERAFAVAERLDPTAAVHAHNRGIALQRLGDLEGAVSAFRRATLLAPGVPASHISLAQLLMRVNETAEAIGAFRDAYACEPQTLRGKLQLAQALIEERDYDSAERILRELEATELRSEQAALLLGRLLQRLGRFEEAETSLRVALERRPSNPRPLFDLAFGRKMTEADLPLVETIRRRRQSVARDDPARADLDYALGKAFSDLGRYGEAMAHYDAANAAMRAEIGPDAFDPEAHRSYYNSLIAAFTPEFYAHYRGYRNPSERPVFVVGMIRSGTTLVDQILSSHLRVSSVDENPYWPRRLMGFFGPNGVEPNEDAARALSEEYLALLGEFDRVTNKLPTNFAVLGAIHLFFPNARFVHVRRDPLDNLLSIWQTRFPIPVRYGHDKANLIAYHREYRRLMAHWRSTLQADRLLEVDYETLVSDGGDTIRAMVEFLGLPWDARCLHPESNPREIRTPSAWQARQPIFRTSVAKWERYEPWLGEFAQLRYDEGG